MTMNFIEDKLSRHGWQGRLFGTRYWLNDCLIYNDVESPVNIVLLQRPAQSCNALGALEPDRSCNKILVQLGEGSEIETPPDIHLKLAPDTPFSTARNFGAALGGSGLLIFMDAEFIPARGFINAYVSQFERQKNLLAARGRIAWPGIDERATIAGNFALPDDIEFWPVDLDENMAVRADAFFGCGGFDEALESGYSSLALSIRLFGRTPDFTSQRYIPKALVSWEDNGQGDMPFEEYFFQRHRSWLDLNHYLKGYLGLYPRFWQENSSRGNLANG